MPAQFQPGRTYQTRSICDHECIYSVNVLSRTAKMITVELKGEIKKFRIFRGHDGEAIRPLGNYSMAPIIRAAQ